MRGSRRWAGVEYPKHTRFLAGFESPLASAKPPLGAADHLTTAQVTHSLLFFIQNARPPTIIPANTPHVTPIMM